MEDRLDTGGVRVASLVVPAALVALLIPVMAGRPGPAVQSVTTPSGSEPAENGPQGLSRNSSGLRMLEEHLGRPASRYDAAAVRQIIATVPDPILSRLDYTYDRYLDAIQRALETDGYRLDRFDIQWMRPRNTLEAQLKEATGDEPPAFARQPGLMLFRHDQRAPLLVYLVGETPTGGVQKDAMTDALTQYAGLEGWLAGPATAPPATAPPETAPPSCQGGVSGARRDVLVLGPSFSGSGESVGRALREWYLATRFDGVRPCARVISGAATALNYNSPIFSPDSQALEELDLSTTVVPDFVARNTFIHYLTSAQGVSCRHIAVVTEANTAYGRHFTDQDPQDYSYALKYDDPCSRDVLTLPFPLHIAELRGEAERARPARAQAPTGLLAPARRNLPIGLTEGRIDRSVVAWASDQEAATAELILSNLLATIAQEGIRYVGLFCTDVRDRIFLAREIQQRAPDVTLFTYTSDQLYLHTDYNAAFRGMLVVSPYPLFSANLVWTEPHEGIRSRLLFPNGNAQGVYNAVLALLGRDDVMLEYARPFETARPGASTVPPLWLSVVGRDAIWPVTLLDYQPLPFLTYQRTPPREAAAAAGSNLARARQLGEQGVLTRTATTILFGLVLACATGSLLIFGASRDATDERSGSTAPGVIPAGTYARWLRIKGDGGELDGERWTYVLALATLTAALQVVITAVLVLPSWALSRLLDLNPLSVSHWLLTAFRLAALALLLVPGLVLARLVRQPFRTGAGRPGLSGLRRGVAPVLVSLAMLVGALALAATWTFQRPTDTWFLCLRASHLFSGVSPLVPVVLLGLTGVMWCLCTLSRLTRSRELGGWWLLDIGEPSWANIAALEARVRRFMDCPAFELPAVALWSMILVLGLAVVMLVSGGSFTVESFVFEGLFVVALAGGYAGLGLALVRGASVWSALRTLLAHVGRHPLSVQLAPLYKDCAGRLQTDPGRGSADEALAISVDHAIRLAEIVDGPAQQELRELAHRARAELTGALDAEARGDWAGRDASCRRAHVALSDTGRVCGRLLEPHWSAGPALPAATPPAAPAASRPSWLPTAERFVAVRLADFILRARTLLRSLAMFGTSTIILLLLALTAYPFNPAGQLQLFNWAVVLTFVAVVVGLLVQMSRDRVLSDLSGTKPGELTFNRELVLRLLLYGAIPLLGMLGAQFPELIGRLQPWIASLSGVK
jgi:hypothetical protein